FLVIAKEQRKSAVVARLEIKVIGRKNCQCVDTRLGSMPVCESQRAGWREREGAIEQPRIHSWRWLGPYVRNLRLTHPIPILECSIDILLKEVDGPKEII